MVSSIQSSSVPTKGAITTTTPVAEQSSPRNKTPSMTTDSKDINSPQALLFSDRTLGKRNQANINLKTEKVIAEQLDEDTVEKETPRREEQMDHLNLNKEMTASIEMTASAASLEEENEAEKKKSSRFTTFKVH